MSIYEDAIIKGLYYIPNYLTDDENKEILKLLKQSDKWSKVGTAIKSRKVLHYGFRYAYNGSGMHPTDPIPAYLKTLVTPARINKLISTDLVKDEFDQLIINEYTPGQGIGPHVDNIEFFDNVIACLSVGSGIGIDFAKDNQKKTIYVKPCSLYIMSGPARYDWKHSISASKYDIGTKRGTRWSLTYRKYINKQVNAPNP